MEAYRRTIVGSIDRAYAVAAEARKRGLDPELAPEIPPAEDMAMRVEKLLRHLPIAGIHAELRELCRSRPREEVAVEIARRIAADPRRGASVEARIDTALRVGLAVLTEGILVAPLEGLAEVHLRGAAGAGYLELYYAGPIRAAGGTAQAMSVLLADVVRQEAGIGRFVADASEIERYREEIPLYKHLQHLQYAPTAEEIATVVRSVPVCISGESTEGDQEVSAFRNLPRVPTNGIRGGACLVIAEGLCQKAAKLRKVVSKLGILGWEFLDELGHHAGSEVEAGPPKYLAEAVGGRPVLGYPGRPGGFRLAYGRARAGGLAACAVNPASMVVLRNFVAIGTQVKLEFPGKASAMTVSDLAQGPLVELEDRTVLELDDADTARAVLPHVRRILDLGELIVPYGEFLENNRALAPGAYTLDWHLAERAAAGLSPQASAVAPEVELAVAESERYGIPLHPRYLLFWHDLSPSEIRALAEWIEVQGRWVTDHLELPAEGEWRELLVRTGFLHVPVGDGMIAGSPVSSAAALVGLGLRAGPDGRLSPRTSREPVDADPLQYVSRLAGVVVRARGPSRVGARVGRPEKARQRTMSPNVHVLFPVGEAGGTHRSVPTAARGSVGSGVPVTVGVRRCPSCGRSTIWPLCACGGHSDPTGESATQPVPIAELWGEAIHRLHLRRLPEVKGVKALMSPGKVPEPLEKGLLRAHYGIAVYQDGTARFDLTDLPLTHFRPREVGLSVARARELGYLADWTGADLVDDAQLLELRPQDVILSRSCGSYLTKLAQFLDDELVRLYHLAPFYQATRAEDLFGEIVVALAPHTSGGVAGRIIGYTRAEACFAHPVFHAAKRRNCDGDEDSVTLLLDALVNFSRAYLPESRGALMDKPLVLTTRLDPTEVDKEAHNLDVASAYPVELYRAGLERRGPKEVEAGIPTVGHRLTAPEPLVGLAFTYDTTDIAGAPVLSAYREAGSMERIVEQSLAVIAQLRAVDVSEAIALVLNHHFLPDLMGNLKSYATQKFRCRRCNASYRRPPLAGRCAASLADGRRCDGELIPTVFEGAVRKYLGLSQRLARHEGVTPYLRQRIQLLESSLQTLFPGTLSQTTLESFGTAATRDRPGAAKDAVAPAS